MWSYREICISEIDKLLQDGYDIEVDSPDGFVPVNFFIDKGLWQEYILVLENGTKVRCNENHLFETTHGWQLAKKLIHMENIQYLTKFGYMSGYVKKTEELIPIVDINVEHENHRYFTNDISSHNTGVGKSIFMCHSASNVLKQGKNVLYITMEMAEEKIAERIDANLLNIPLSEIETIDKDVYLGRVEKLAKKTHGKLIIKEYPTSSAHAGHFRALLEELKIKKGFIPDFICIDYINICASQRIRSGSDKTYTYVKAIAEEIRGLAVEYNVPILSATQTNREGMNNTDIDITNTSESIGLPQTVDMLFALIGSEELDALNQQIVKQLKNRYNDLNYYKRFVIGLDKSKMRYYDVESSAQVNISDSGQPKDEPLFDKGNFGRGMTVEKNYDNFKF